MLDGQPLQHGTIRFYSESSPSISGTIIKEGAYKLPETGGLLPGLYKVAISSSEASGKIADPDAVMAAGITDSSSKDQVPSRYNSKTELSYEVTSSKNNTANFDLNSNK